MSTDAIDDLLLSRQFMTAAGTETYLAFQQQFPLREFCAFEIFEHDTALAELEQQYLFPLISAVDAGGHGLLLDALIWRAHPDYIEALGYAESDLARLNQLAASKTRQAVEAWRQRESRDADTFPVLLAADIGPRGDGYQGSDVTVAEAFGYHRAQLGALEGSGVDVVCALTMTNVNEAIGLTEAARELEVPILISATVETDGRLPDGSTLGDFIHRVDDATGSSPLYYLVNCAHPTHLVPSLEAARASGEDWLDRFKGFRANSSKMSHEELDNSTELDRGNPAELAAEVAAMRHDYDLRVVGGCCGTDVEHIAAISRAIA
ncbi:MAG: homocysteine S-methyltransferase family protein [Gammaproteobacteria bacterium]|jgi:homocysteine S-methyltransferase